MLHVPSFISRINRTTDLFMKIKITRLLPSKFALVVDGWISTRIQFFSVLASFLASNELKYITLLLSFSNFE